MWRAIVRKRASTDLDVLDHPLVAEAYSAGVRRGYLRRLSIEAEFAHAIDINRRVADLLEEIVYQRDAIDLLDDEKGEV